MLKKMTKTFGAVLLYGTGLGCIPDILSKFIDHQAHKGVYNTVLTIPAIVWSIVGYKYIKNIWHDSEDATKLLGAANTDATIPEETSDEI
jgi:hypothetical protein